MNEQPQKQVDAAPPRVRLAYDFSSNGLGDFSGTGDRLQTWENRACLPIDPGNFDAVLGAVRPLIQLDIRIPSQSIPLR